MSQSNFMRNLRMSMPQYITNVTSFNDAVKILKNKRILNESHEGNDQWFDAFPNLRLPKVILRDSPILEPFAFAIIGTSF